MYLWHLVIFVMFFAGTNLMKNELISILELRKNLFYTVNEDIHNSINKIFSVLKLGKKLTNSSEMLVLLALHSELTKISEENYREYDKMKNISKSEGDKKINLNLYELVCEIFKEHRYYLRHRKHKRKNRSDNYTEPEEPLDFIKDFVDKLNTFTEEKPAMENIDDVQMARTPKPRHYHYDINVWRPPYNTPESDANDIPSTRRIYRGKRTTFKKHPFIVSIHIMGEFFCAGSIITNDMVITAASCLQIAYTSKIFNANTRSVTVRVGSDFTNRYGELIPMAEIFFHPKFHALTLKNNLAIVRLSKSLNFGIKILSVRRIQYVQENRSFIGKEKVKVLGWGANTEFQSDEYLNRLSFAHLGIYNFDKCRDLYSRFYVTGSNFCAGFVSDSSGTCNRDVGGPAVVGAVLVGVISFGPRSCGVSDAPTVFTRLSRYTEWIDSIVHKVHLQETTVEPNILPVTMHKNIELSSGSAKHLEPFMDYGRLQTASQKTRKSMGLRDLIQDLLIRNENSTDVILDTEIKPEISTDISKQSLEDGGLSLEEINQIGHADVNKSTTGGFKRTMWGSRVSLYPRSNSEIHTKPQSKPVNTTSTSKETDTSQESERHINVDLIAPVIDFFKKKFFGLNSTYNNKIVL